MEKVYLVIKDHGYGVMAIDSAYSTKGLATFAAKELQEKKYSFSETKVYVREMEVKK